MEKKKTFKDYWIISLIGIILIVIIGGIIYWFFFRTSKVIDNQEEVSTEELTIDELTSEEIDKISKSIVRVRCWNDLDADSWIAIDEYVYGSGTYLHLSLIKDEGSREPFNFYDGSVLTNGHLAILNPSTEIDGCFVEFEKKKVPGFNFDYDDNIRFLNDDLDIALLRYREVNEIPDRGENFFKERLLENYPTCPKDKIIGSKVYTFGYPATGSEYVASGFSWEGDAKSLKRNLIVSMGMISGIDSHENYYTDANIDSGSSGGLAVSKINGEICIVGIPTWISGGEFETLGIIQPFNKIHDAGIDWSVVPTPRDWAVD